MPCVGARNKEIIDNHVVYDPDYTFITYGELLDISCDFSSGLLTLIDDHTKFVTIASNNCIKWYITDIACIIGNMVSVPIHTVFDTEAIEYIVQKTDSSIVISSNEQIEKFFEVMPNSHTIKYLICMDNLHKIDIPDNIDRSKVLSFDQVIHIGTENRHLYDFPIYAEDKEDIRTLIFTSGSTGRPKGAIYTDFMVSRGLSEFHLGGISVRIVVLPLAHGNERLTSYSVFSSGGRLAIFDRNMQHLFEEIRIVRPTEVSFVPRIWNMLYNDYCQKLEYEIESNINEDIKVIKDRIMDHFSKILGDRISRISTGSAYTSESVKSWLKQCFSKCFFSEGYGTTEAGNIAGNDYVKSEVEVRLVDVPELGYTKHDLPHPRGELWTKSYMMSPGYYNDKENQRNNYSEDGFFNTGDIVEYNENTGEIKIIDRSKNVFKLAQGEFVAPEYLEGCYVDSCFIDTIVITGIIDEEFVIGIVIPNMEYSIRWGFHNGIEQEQLLSNIHFKNAILEDLVRIANNYNRIQSYEIPVGIIIDDLIFSADNRLLTPSKKLNRTVIKKYYAEDIASIYQNIKSVNFKNALEDLQRVLECQDQVISLDELGIDSVSKIRLHSFVNEKYKVDIPMEILFSKETNLKKLAEFLSYQKDDKPTESIHWDKEKEMPPEVIENLKKYQRKERGANSIAFLTGATGFIGAYLLRDIIETNQYDTIYCLVRNSDKYDPMKRIRDNLTTYGIWEPYFKEKIIIVNGDLSQPHLGMTDSKFNELSTNIDIIYHNGCRVNGILPYEILKYPNVLGTKNILKLATRTHVKPVIYISTLSVWNNEFSEHIKENLVHFQELDKKGGYGSSKAISEILISAAGDFGLPFVIHRLGTIVGDTVLGRSNTGDFVNRLLIGIIQMKCYPNTYQTIEMTPVDYCSKCIIELSDISKYNGSSFHIQNYNRSKTMKEIASFLIDIGHNIEQLPISDWIGIARELTSANVLYPLKSYFDGGRIPLGCNFPEESTLTELAQLGIKPPEITRELIHKFVLYFQQQEFI
eukprot:TRINITY_DN2449_c0_g1_i1.p1 TRINITY_DN2449_c0_g1~~TRINITY_DN2449_c0_g1_i1.p1  ORF type:complete len:1031 (+),score=216.99 TRINITY_DN2449_c0_g1_i1:389-3481(+)